MTFQVFAKIFSLGAYDRVAFVSWKDLNIKINPALTAPLTTNKKVEFNSNNKVTIKK